MRTFMEAATGLPGILFTAALVVVVCFWLLVAVGLVDVDSFDTDVDLGAWSMDGVPVSVALSLLTAFAWSLNVGVTVLIAALATPGAATGVLRMGTAAGALPAAWWLTCLFLRRLRRLVPHEPVPPSPSGTSRGPTRP
ncbi:hypothetical protein [Streptomyces sp. NPDC096324]|uniref:hypothetical protein n=1 Tax=Streptomyces sp. NPDC096324 TaxID=3366085 RepID=UPI00381588E0